MSGLAAATAAHLAGRHGCACSLRRRPLAFRRRCRRAAGFAVSATRLGLPDAGLISYAEMVDQASLQPHRLRAPHLPAAWAQALCLAGPHASAKRHWTLRRRGQGRQLTSAASIPIIGDGDTGYGNAVNVKKTVRGYALAGFAGILIEDQVSPKACGHTQGRKVVPREEATMRIRAAADAREEGAFDIVIVARTDARQAISLAEALARVQGFAEAGADVLFIDALTTEDEMRAFCKILPDIPKMANMLEGGGCTPILSPDQLASIGFKLVAYPLSLLGVSIRAMQDALAALNSGRMPPPAVLPTFEEIKSVVGFPEYYADAQRYATESNESSEQRVSQSSRLVERKREASWEEAMESSRPGAASHPTEHKMGPSGMNITRKSDNEQQRNLLKATLSTREGSLLDSLTGEYLPPDTKEQINPLKSPNYTSHADGVGLQLMKLRLRISGRNGITKLDARYLHLTQAGFLNGVAQIISEVDGLDLKDMLSKATSTFNTSSGDPILETQSRNDDCIQIFLERSRSTTAGEGYDRPSAMSWSARAFHHTEVTDLGPTEDVNGKVEAPVAP
eukprot:SM000250S08717  [mRNA]  locus=s250:98011:103891:+ [translate_table: standard]